MSHVEVARNGDRVDGISGEHRKEGMTDRDGKQEVVDDVSANEIDEESITVHIEGIEPLNFLFYRMGPVTLAKEAIRKPGMQRACCDSAHEPMTKCCCEN